MALRRVAPTINRRTDVVMHCQYPECPFEATHIAKRLNIGPVDLCAPHMAIFRIAPFSDLWRLDWQPEKAVRNKP